MSVFSVERTTGKVTEGVTDWVRRPLVRAPVNPDSEDRGWIPQAWISIILRTLGLPAQPNRYRLSVAQAVAQVRARSVNSPRDSPEQNHIVTDAWLLRISSSVRQERKKVLCKGKEVTTQPKASFAEPLVPVASERARLNFSFKFMNPSCSSVIFCFFCG